MLIWLICPHLSLLHFLIHESFPFLTALSFYFEHNLTLCLFMFSLLHSHVFVLPLSCFLFPLPCPLFNPCASLINPSYPSLAIYSFYSCPSAWAYFHIPELIPLSPRFQPVVFPVSLLIRLSLALVLLIPEGFVYLCWSCFYSLRLTPPIFSPVI